MAKSKTYEEFVDKFKPKLTTDDCYTPPAVYAALTEWIDANIMPLDGVQVLRPFYPGGDYEHADYPEGAVVIDNPPFSILAQIIRFYADRRIPFFLFAPTLTLFSACVAERPDVTFIVPAAQLTYDNGASIATSFVTNMLSDGTKVWMPSGLRGRLEEACKPPLYEKWGGLPVYVYPDNVISSALLGVITKGSRDLRISRDECTYIRRLDSQREAKKSIFGNGFLLSDKAAAAWAAAREAAAREKLVWPLSERERDIINKLGDKSPSQDQTS
jgi:hypothetical protein